MIGQPSFWESAQRRHEELSEKLAAGQFEASLRHKLQKEYSFLSTILEKYQEVARLEAELASLKAESASADPEMKELFDEEQKNIEQRISGSDRELEDLMYPPDPMDQRSIFLEIRPGAGGQEAALFVGDLMTMYTNYALKRGWRVTPLSLMATDLGGYKEVILEIDGKRVYGDLKFEAGVHRVQRVPATETQGRVHTSTATVAIIPEAKEVEISINPADLRIDVYRSSGAGGQHVNTTDSAVRITHIPTGVVVACQDERSQHKNKAKALKVLQSRILAAEREKHEEEQRKMRKEMVGTGMRAEKVRTYNYPQNRVTDHQVELTLNKLDMVMEGDLDDIIQALHEKERHDRRSKPLESLFE